MKVYTVHVRDSEAGGDDPARQADAIFVREGFSFWAFLFQPLWALYHRLWLVAAAMVVFVILLNVMIQSLGLSAIQVTLLQLLTAIYIGAEANNFRRWTLDRRGYVTSAVVVGENLTDAETRYFGRVMGLA